MKRKFQIPVLFLACGALIFSGSDLMAQGNGKGKDKQKDKQKEYKVKEKEKDDDKDIYKVKTNGNGKIKSNGNGKAKGNSRKFAHATPHNVKVPPGHYPPAGHYRIWYPGRPPGHQPQPVPYGHPANAPITDGAFILHGNKAYDTQYDWRQHEQRKPKTVPREVIDILFPGNTVPAQ